MHVDMYLNDRHSYCAFLAYDIIEYEIEFGAISYQKSSHSIFE